MEELFGVPMNGIMVVARDLEQGAELFETLVDNPGDLIKVALVPGG